MNNTTLSARCLYLTHAFKQGNITFEELLDFVKCHPTAKMEKTQYIENEDLLKRLTMAYTVVLIVTSILGIIGNSFVISAYVKQFRILNSCRFLNLHLACCDVTFAIMQLFTATPAFTGKFGERKWPFGLAFCKISRAFLLLGGMIALATILIIAVERYHAILHPFSAGARSTSQSRVKKALAVAWVAGLGSSVPAFLVYAIDEKNGSCAENWSSHTKLEKAFKFYVLVVFGILPLSIIAFCYSKIIRAMKMPKEAGGIFANMPEEDVKRRRKSEMQIIKMLILVVIAFFLCVLPGQIINVIVSFVGKTLPVNEAFTYAFVGFVTYPFHVAVNPFIYSLKDRAFLANAWCKAKPKTDLSTKATSMDELSNMKLTSFSGLKH